MGRLLVTGSEGQLGTSLRHLLARFPEWEVDYVDIADLDITDADACDRFFASHGKYDFIINCAAYTAVDRAEDDVDNAFRVNADAVRNLASIASRTAARIIHISTDYVFSGSASEPYKETDSTGPVTVYGRSKLEGERLLFEACPDAVVIRTSWLCSPYGRNFFLTMRGKALEGAPVRVVADQHGCPTFASDLATAILKIVSSPRWVPGIYHFSGSGPTTWFGFTRAIYRLCGADENLVSPISSDEYPARACRPEFSVLDTSKIQSVYGVNVPAWEASLRTLIQSLDNGTE